MHCKGGRSCLSQLASGHHCPGNNIKTQYATINLILFESQGIPPLFAQFFEAVCRMWPSNISHSERKWVPALDLKKEKFSSGWLTRTEVEKPV